jgi:hypothetical protein
MRAMRAPLEWLERGAVTSAEAMLSLFSRPEWADYINAAQIIGAIATSFAALLAAGSVLAILLQTRSAARVARESMNHNRRTSIVVMQSTILKDLKLEFKELRAARTEAALYGLKKLDSGPFEKWEDVPSGLWQLMDFFDLISMYFDHDSLDEEMVFVAFFYWLHPYWSYFHDDVQRMKIANPLAMYDQIPLQIDRLLPVGRRLKARIDDLDTSNSTLEKFFRAEIAECGLEVRESVGQVIPPAR